MRIKSIAISFIIIILLILVFAYFFLYNIYGIEISRVPDSLFADPSSEITLSVLPINALGKKALYRSSSAKFEILEGNDLVEIVFVDESKGQIKLRSTGKSGVVGIKIKSQFSIFQEYIEIEIKSLTV